MDAIKRSSPPRALQDAGWYQWPDAHMAKESDMWSVNRNFGQTWTDPALHCECGEDYMHDYSRRSEGAAPDRAAGRPLPLCTNVSSVCVGDGKGSLRPLSDAAHAAGMIHSVWCGTI